MKVGVFGAGAIGASLGIRLSSAGVAVRMLGRASLREVADELVLHAHGGTHLRPGADFTVDDDPAILRDVDLCLVTVKSRDTAAAAATLADVLRPSALVVSFQNGLRNAARLRAGLSQTVSAGMVSYNVVRPDRATFRQATKGPLIAAAQPGTGGEQLARLAAALRDTGDRLSLRSDIDDVMAGKLLLNLNNGICAVAGVTIAQSIRDRTLRTCFAALMREGLRIMGTAGLRPRSIVGVSPGVIARMLTLPNFVVLRLAKSMVAIDPQAKSSTLQDLEAGKPTEIDDLCGEITHLAQQAGRTAPANQCIVDAVHVLETQSPREHWTPTRLAQELGV